MLVQPGICWWGLLDAEAAKRTRQSPWSAHMRSGNTHDRYAAKDRHLMEC